MQEIVHTETKRCDICGDPAVVTQWQEMVTRYFENGREVVTPLYYKTCSECGSEFADADDVRKNLYGSHGPRH